MKKQKLTPHTNNMEKPEWLHAIFRDSNGSFTFQDAIAATGDISESFRKRCREAANRALTLAKLRRECERVGFAALPLDDYLKQLSRYAKVDLAPCLKAYNITGLANPTVRSAKGIGRLTHNIGMGLPESLMHVRIGLLQASGTRTATLFHHRARSRVRRNELEECEAVVCQFERELKPEIRLKSRQVEEAIRSAYETAEWNVG